MITILIVEDDENIARMISTVLSIGGYRSEICADGALAVEKINQKVHGYDLVLLDIMLPGLDGFSVIQRIQSREVPVIFLTAMQNVSDKVKGLRLGAEDYIVKPFEAVELLARVDVVLRRSHRSQEVVAYGNITVYVQEHTALMDGNPVSLTPKEFDLLVFFLQNQDIALTRERLLAAVWGYDYAGETRTVDIHVQQLRRKMHQQNGLVTITKLGYRLNRHSHNEPEGGAPV